MSLWPARQCLRDRQREVAVAGGYDGAWRIVRGLLNGGRQCGGVLKDVGREKEEDGRVSL